MPQGSLCRLIGEICCYTISKEILLVIKHDIVNVAGCSQLCECQNFNYEAVICCIMRMFESEDKEKLLLVDASNTFNSLNWQLLFVISSFVPIALLCSAC